jgi:hypothetical protein
MRTPDAIALHKAHVRANLSCERWLKQVVKYREAGNSKKALETMKKAEQCMLKILKIERIRKQV